MSKADSPLKTNTSTLRSYRTLSEHIKDPLYRNSYFLIANIIVTTGMGFLFWIIVARFYDKADVGLSTAILSVMGLIGIFSRMGFEVVLIRFLSKVKTPINLINSSLTITTVISLLLAVIFVIGVNLWTPALTFIRDNIVFATVFIIFTTFLALSSMMDSIFIGKRRAGFVLSKNTAISLLKMSLPFVLVLFFKAFGIVSSIGIATAIIVTIYSIIVLPRVQNGYKPMLKIDLSIVRDVKKYALNNYVISLLSVAPVFILPILIVNNLTAEDSAYYYMTSMIAGILFFIPAAVSQSLLSESSHFEEHLSRDVFRSYKFIFILLIPIIILVLLFGRWLLLIFGADYSENGLSLLRVLAISSVFVSINSVYSTILIVKHKLRERIAIISFTSISLLVAIYFIIPSTGIVGIGYIWMAVYGIVSIYVIVALRRFL